MKRLLLVAALVLFCLYGIAQTPKLVATFNNLPQDGRNHIEIKKINNKWVAHSYETEQNLAFKLNTSGTYLELKDPGTGGGTTTFQLKIFKDNSGKEFIAINRSWTDGAMYEGGVNFVYADGSDVSMAFWPDYGEELNFKEGETKEGNEDYFTGEYSFCNIPELGSTIEILPGYTGITGGCINEDKKACDLKKKLVEKIVFAWSKEHNMFMPK